MLSLLSSLTKSLRLMCEPCVHFYYSNLCLCSSMKTRFANLFTNKDRQSDYTLPDQESACYFLCNMHQMCLTKQALSVGIGRAQVITRTSSNEKIKRAPFVNLNKDRE